MVTVRVAPHMVVAVSVTSSPIAMLGIATLVLCGSYHTVHCTSATSDDNIVMDH